MELTLNAVKLKKCVEPCATLVGKLDKGFDLQYSNIQFVVENNFLTLYATDTSIFIKTEYGLIEGDPIPDIDVSIPADNLHIVVSDLTDVNDEVNLSFKGKYVKITHKKQKFTLNYYYNPELSGSNIDLYETPEAFKRYNNKIFVDIINAPITNLFTMPFSKFKTILNSLLPCMSKSPAESRLYGIYFDGNFYASNNVSFTGCYKSKIPFPELENIDHVFFQNGVIQFLLKIGITEDPFSLAIKGNQICASINEATILFRNNLVNFIPVNVLESFIEGCDKKFTIMSNDLTPLIRKAIPFSDTLNRFYGEILFKPDRSIKISVSDQHKKSSTVEYTSEFDDDLLEVQLSRGINLDLVYAALQNIESDKVFLHYNSKELKPLIFIDDGGIQYYYISPIRKGSS